MVYGETPGPRSALGPVRLVRHQRRSGEYHWGRAAIQVAFTIFVLTETWFVPLEGYLIDKFAANDRRKRRLGGHRLGKSAKTVP
jgi:hypothetical protein